VFIQAVSKEAVFRGNYTCTGTGFKPVPAIKEVFIELLSR
jgi:hypothetical protein